MALSALSASRRATFARLVLANITYTDCRVTRASGISAARVVPVPGTLRDPRVSRCRSYQRPATSAGVQKRYLTRCALRSAARGCLIRLKIALELPTRELARGIHARKHALCKRTRAFGWRWSSNARWCVLSISSCAKSFLLGGGGGGLVVAVATSMLAKHCTVL